MIDIRIVIDITVKVDLDQVAVVPLRVIEKIRGVRDLDPGLKTISLKTAKVLITMKKNLFRVDTIMQTIIILIVLKIQMEMRAAKKAKKTMILMLIF
jgi:hypothetical protein